MTCTQKSKVPGSVLGTRYCRGELSKISVPLISKSKWVEVVDRSQRIASLYTCCHVDDRELKPTIIHKIFETNSSLHVKWHATGKVQEFISVFQEIFISSYKIFI